MRFFGRIDAWYETRPSWIRLPLYAAGVAAGWSLFIGLAGLLNTLQPPRNTLREALLASAWLALHGALGGLAYALLSPRFLQRGIAGRFTLGALTVMTAAIPSLVLALRTFGIGLASTSWFWIVLFALLALGALVIGRPWQGQRRQPQLARSIRQKPPASARDYGLEIGTPAPSRQHPDQPHN